MDKRYEEALERAKMILCNLPEGSSSARDIETIFPELMGDEEMMEFMRNHFYNLVKRQDENERMYTRCLVYLDKLKEQKAIQDSVAVVTTSRPTISKFEAGKAAVLNNPEEYGLRKLSEWSEEDKKMLGKVVECITYVADRNLLDGDVSETRLKAWLLSHLTHGPHWRRAKEGSNLPESIILPDGEEPRFGKCAVKDSWYIPISELKELPKE